MLIRTAWFSLLLLCLGVGLAQGQIPGSAVQLPTYSYFGGNSTVLVPDGGSTFFGGINRASSARNEFGSPLLPFRGVGIGSRRSASSMHITATIHDFAAMDEYLLSQAAQRTTFPVRLTNSRPLPRSNPDTWQVVAPRSSISAENLSASVAEERLRRTRLSQARESEAAEYFQRGQRAEAAGKNGAAKIFYQMAARRANGQLKQQLTKKLETFSRKQAGSAVVHTDLGSDRQ